MSDIIVRVAILIILFLSSFQIGYAARLDYPQGSLCLSKVRWFLKRVSGQKTPFYWWSKKRLLKITPEFLKTYPTEEYALTFSEVEQFAYRATPKEIKEIVRYMLRPELHDYVHYTDAFIARVILNARFPKGYKIKGQRHFNAFNVRSNMNTAFNILIEYDFLHQTDYAFPVGIELWDLMVLPTKVGENSNTMGVYLADLALTSKKPRRLAYFLERMSESPNLNLWINDPNLPHELHKMVRSIKNGTQAPPRRSAFDEVFYQAIMYRLNLATDIMYYPYGQLHLVQEIAQIAQSYFGPRETPTLNNYYATLEKLILREKNHIKGSAEDALPMKTLDAGFLQQIEQVHRN